MFVALGIQNSMWMRHIVIVVCPALQCFSTSSHTRQDFRGGGEVTDHKVCALILSTTFVWNISHSKNNSERDDQIRILFFMWSARFSCQILMKLKFSRHIFKNIYSNIKYALKSVQWKSSCSMRTGRRTNMTKIIVAFRNFANAPQEKYRMYTQILQHQTAVH